jgi:hypothetical protein
MRKLILSLILLAVLLLPVSATYANTPQPAKGDFTYSVVSQTYVNDPSGIPYYDILAAGNYTGDVTGPHTEELFSMLLPSNWQTFHGTGTCDPCTVFGKTGTMSYRASGIQTPGGQFNGTLTITGGTGELANISGGGTYQGLWVGNEAHGTYDLMIDLGQ